MYFEAKLNGNKYKSMFTRIVILGKFHYNKKVMIGFITISLKMITKAPKSISAFYSRENHT